MTNAIIITFCTLLLIAYLFDLSFSKTKIPSVILLLILGWIVKQLMGVFNIHLPDFSPMLPILGSIGLILIVLEGSLELELHKSKLGLIKKSLFGSVIPVFTIAFILAYVFQYYTGCSIKIGLANAIPFCVISSAIAIPSISNLKKSDREFVIYESSLSDIVGVLFFNFITLNATINASAFGNFGLQLLIIIVISFIATIVLAFLLSKINHHIKFAPIILLIILIYEISKIYHLPSLIFILIFGLFIGNLDELKRFSWVEKFKPDILNKEVQKFKALNTEGSFLVRALFFLLFGYLIDSSEILNPKTIVWSLGITFLIFAIRSVQLFISKMPLMPLLFVAPRGLITVLLFLTLSTENQIFLVNKSLLIQVILLTAIVMMVGLLLTAKISEKEKKETF